MSGKFLPTLVFLTILAVGILFVFSILNPIENSRITQDREILNLLQSEVNASASAGSKCFKPSSKYYQNDPRTVYDSKAITNFSGYLCLGR